MKNLGLNSDVWVAIGAIVTFLNDDSDTYLIVSESKTDSFIKKIKRGGVKS